MTEFMPKIPAEEYTARVDAMRKKMEENGVDLVVVFSNLLDPSANTRSSVFRR